MLEISAPAKINLVLDVTGKEGRLHTVDTLIYPVSLYDTVRMKPSDVTTVKYVGKRGVYPGDTVLKTLEVYKKIYGERGVEIEIIKRIPEKAGLGGSSADAAAVARGLEELFLYPSVGAEKLLEVGSDVPAMYENSPQRATSFGERTTPFVVKKKIYFAVLLGGEVDTGKCYGLFDETGGERPEAQDVVEALRCGEYFTPVNALERAAEIICPDVREKKKLLSEAGFICSMTGSGSAVFGYEYDLDLFENKLAFLKKAAGKKYKTITF